MCGGLDQFLYIAASAQCDESLAGSRRSQPNANGRERQAVRGGKGGRRARACVRAQGGVAPPAQRRDQPYCSVESRGRALRVVVTRARGARLALRRGGLPRGGGQSRQAELFPHSGWRRQQRVGTRQPRRLGRHGRRLQPMQLVHREGVPVQRVAHEAAGGHAELPHAVVVNVVPRPLRRRAPALVLRHAPASPGRLCGGCSQKDACGAMGHNTGRPGATWGTLLAMPCREANCVQCATARNFNGPGRSLGTQNLGPGRGPNVRPSFITKAGSAGTPSG